MERIAICCAALVAGVAAVGCPGPLIQVADLCDGASCAESVADGALVDAVQTDAAGPDAALPDVGLPDAAAVDAARFDVVAADLALPDSVAADTALSDSVAADTALPDSAAADTALPDSAAADTALPDSAAADTALPDSAAADTAQADAALPDTATPDTATPDTTRPDTSQPDVGGPDAARPDTGGAGGLVAAISIRTVTVDEGSISSSTQYEYGPFLAPLPDGRAKLAWCDSSADKIYLRHLDATLETAERADTVVDGEHLFGLTAHADGRSALLAARPAPGSCAPCTASTECVSCGELYLVQIGDDGTVIQEQLIDDRLSWSGMHSGGGIAVGVYSGEETYAVARTVRGAGPDGSASAVCTSSASNSGHQWHETWLYKASDLSEVRSGCNVFPCGHSLYKRSVAYHPDDQSFGSVCVSDYSGGRTGFNYAENSGWNHRLYNVWEDWPDFTNGGHPSELVVANATSYLVALTAPQSCASGCGSEDHDLAVMQVSHATQGVVGGPWWLSAGVGDENYPHLARYGSDYLVGWAAGSERWLLELDGSGAIVAGPEALGGVTSFDYGAGWQTIGVAGDVVWPLRVSATTIDIVRVAR